MILGESSTFTSTAGVTQTISGGITGTGNLAINANSTGNFTFSTGSVNNGGSITNSGSGSGVVTISAVIGANVTGGVTQDSATSNLTLGGVANLFTGGLNVKQGTVTGGGNAATFGASTSTITLGTANTALSATLLTTSSQNYANPIATAANSTGVLSIGGAAGNAQFSGGITLNNSSLRFTHTGATNPVISGGVTGTGNILLASNSTGTTTFQTAAVNNIGTFTNNGGGSGTLTFATTAAIGANVTQVVQNSLTSSMTLQSTSNAFFYNGTTNLGLFIKAGLVTSSSTTNGALTTLGTGRVTLGDTEASTAFATLRVGGAANQIYANPIVLGSGTTGTLTIAQNNTGGASIENFSGGVTGTNNLTILTGPVSTSTVSVTPLNFITAPIDIGGTLTHATTTHQGTLTISGGLGSNLLGLVQNSSTAKMVISTTNASYNAPTTVSLGTLQLSGGVSLAGSAVGVSAGGTFLVDGNSTLGTSGNGSLTLAGGPTTTGGLLSTIGATTNTLTIKNAGGGTALTLGGTSGNAAQWNAEVGAVADQIILDTGLGAIINAGGFTVNLTGLGGLTGTNQTLITAPGGLTVNGPITINVPLSGNFGGNTIGYTTTATALILTETANAAPDNAYWNGAAGASWNSFSGGSANNSSWLDATAGVDTHANPGAGTNVFMTATTAANLTTTLGQNYEINSLTFTGTGTSGTAAVQVNGANTLQIDAAGVHGNTAGVGIVKLLGSGTTTIAAPLILGASQSWTSDAATALAVTGGVTGTANLTLNTTNAATTGTITLSGSPINIAGTITNASTGGSTVTLSGGVGSNVTAITENSATSALTVTTGALTVNGSGTTLTNSNPSGTKVLTVSGGIGGTGPLILKNNSAIVDGIVIAGSLNNSGTVTNNGTGTAGANISAIIGTNVTSVTQNSTTSSLTLSGANAFTNNGTTTFGLRVKAGTVIGGNASAFGAGPVALGDSVSNSSNATLLGVLTNGIFANPISLADITTATGTLAIGTSQSSTGVTFTGGVTGNNNLSLTATGAGTATFSTGSVNNTGTVTNIGTGSGTVTINVLGTNVTSVAQAGTNPFVIAAPLDLTATNKTLTSSGTGLFTISGGITGAQNLVLNATVAGGITLSTTSVNNTGNITISGAGTGANTSARRSGSNVGDIFYNAAGGNFTLSGATVANTGNITLSGTGATVATISAASITNGGAITLSGTGTSTVLLGTGAINNSGLITNSGTTTGTSTISGIIGASVTGWCKTAPPPRCSSPVPTPPSPPASRSSPVW